ncbi:uncharacterized protein [Typha angustifolia]|uniref:uncharacterized protein isoform X2 n=1 Tax=Typha angustifolia TaxID=59011 RepID=UPI003C2F0B3D
MKRPAQWEKSLAVSSDDSSDSDSEDNAGLKNENSRPGQSSKDIKFEAIARKRKHGGMDYDALRRHGYKGGPSVLKVPPPKVEEKEQDWSWSTGKQNDAKDKLIEESYEDRERTRAALARGEKLLGVQTNLQANKERKSQSFSQKEKRKRDLGQASRGKNYVEEEKRLLRDSGVYSGFDS